MPKTLNISSHGLSDVGRVRQRNEDFFLIDDTTGLYIVADGMGGHAGGGRASRLAVEQVAREVTNNAGDTTAPPANGDITASKWTQNTLLKALKSANDMIHNESDTIEELRGMGTTATALYVKGNEITIAHVGDSRAYLIRDGSIMQITEDHSWVNEQVKAGFITPDEAKTHKFKNVITRSLGHEKDVQVDIFSLEIETGDHFIICSDGLTNLVEDSEILSTISQSPSQEGLGKLVEIANGRGGHDNITAVLVNVLPA